MFDFKEPVDWSNNEDLSSRIKTLWQRRSSFSLGASLQPQQLHDHLAGGGFFDPVYLDLAADSPCFVELANVCMKFGVQLSANVTKSAFETGDYELGKYGLITDMSSLGRAYNNNLKIKNFDIGLGIMMDFGLKLEAKNYFHLLKDEAVLRRLYNYDNHLKDHDKAKSLLRPTSTNSFEFLLKNHLILSAQYYGELIEHFDYSQQEESLAIAKLIVQSPDFLALHAGNHLLDRLCEAHGQHRNQWSLMEPFLMDVLKAGARPWQFAEKNGTIMSHCAKSNEVSIEFMEYCVARGGSFAQMVGTNETAMSIAIEEQNHQTVGRMFEVMMKHEPAALLAPISKYGDLFHTRVAKALCRDGNGVYAHIIKTMLNAGMSIRLQDSRGQSIEQISKEPDAARLRAVLASLEAGNVASELKAGLSL